MGVSGVKALFESDFLLEVLVKVCGTLPILSQVICLDESWLVTSLVVDNELLCLLVVVHEIIVGQL